jgi:hypothetical protein
VPPLKSSAPLASDVRHAQTQVGPFTEGGRLGGSLPGGETGAGPDNRHHPAVQ